MDTLKDANRVMCVNCYVCVNRLYRTPALEQDAKVASVLCTWVHPQIITENDVICRECLDLAILHSNIKQEPSENLEQDYSCFRGHKNICLLCGRSILNKQSHKIIRSNPSHLVQSIIDIIYDRVAPRQISESDGVCHACWLRTKRQVHRLTKNIRRPESMEADVLFDNQLQSSSTAEAILQDNSSLDHTNETDIMQETQTSKPITIELPDYRRAPNTGNRCVFINCRSKSLRTISNKLRLMVLSTQKFYLPKMARICQAHLESDSWDTLYEMKNSIAEFNADQIQHIFSFINPFNNSLNFENIDELDENLLEFWTGLTKDKFTAILDEFPQIKSTKRGALGLIALLIKMRSGDSNQRISTLFKTARTTFEVTMHKIRTILLENLPNNDVKSKNHEILLDLLTKSADCRLLQPHSNKFSPDALLV